MRRKRTRLLSETTLDRFESFWSDTTEGLKINGIVAHRRVSKKDHMITVWDSDSTAYEDENGKVRFVSIVKEARLFNLKKTVKISKYKSAINRKG